MGLIERVLGFVFGGNGNSLRETVEVFRENAEAASRRGAILRGRALAQFGDEFHTPRRGLFDRLMDGVNRLPRPALALGTLGLFITAMIDPVWFAERMQGIALVPEPLWWLLGAIVSFYFGARHQAKGQEFQRQITRTLEAVPQVVGNIESLRALESGAGRPAMANTGHDAALTLETDEPETNPALSDWQRSADLGR